MWHVSILTLFPDIFPGPLEHSLVGKALNKKLWHLSVKNIRDYALDKHKIVDDKPFGGGAGMVLRPDVISTAIDQVKLEDNIEEIVYLSPKGELFNQNLAESLVNKRNLLFLCGRYEGVDQRVIDKYNMREVSIGDYILSGGEVAALVIIDCCVRLLPDVLGKDLSLVEESFATSGAYKNLLEYPQYTRPAIWNDLAVPSILLSGHHENIQQWRLEQAKHITKLRRPDLWQKYCMAKQTK